MESKNEYITLLSSIVAASFVVTKNKGNGLIYHIELELKRILSQTDFDNIECIYENVLDFFSRIDDNMTPEDIEELARITQLSVTSTIGNLLGLELASLR